MVPVDTKCIKEEYETLLNELTQFNPELLDKHRLLAITKSDMADEEIKEALKKEVPDVKYIFISAITGEGITQLKDMLWEELNK
jgi:GTP-binding protein